MRDKKDEEDGGWSNPFDNLEKSSVLQEARLFHEMPIVPRKCCLVLTKILYLIYQGEQIGTTEATEAFFAMTKLFQCGDVNLRRMVYLTIKEMSNLADDVIIVTSSLTKDMTGKEDQYRAAAIRALCKITDGTMLQGIERYMKQAIVDRVSGVSSAALVSSLHLCKENLDVVKRWVNEVQQAVNSKSQISQYHALGLLYHLKRKDKLAVQKLVTTQMRNPPKSPFAVCLLIRYARTSLQQDPDGDNSRAFFDFLESCLRHKSEMVIYEAARAIVNMEDVTPRELAPAISVLQLFLSSPKAVLRFAAVRTLNKIAMTHPLQLTSCNLDMENLITDSNRSIATLAITTLLKTGSESSVDRLMKQIGGFMGEISDEFKIVVVEAIRSLCLKFPKKHAIMMSFLSDRLRDEGGFNYKKAIVDTIVSVIEHVSEVRETGLAHLCEFIEDCEYTSLSVRILHILGIEGPRTPSPSKYIRYIYNRLILENSTVRAAAVSALARFGTQNEVIRPSVIVLLKRCLYDTEDEVRDRAALSVKLLEDVGASASKYLLNNSSVSIVGLERALLEYVEAPNDQGFDIKSVPIEAEPASIAEEQAVMSAAIGGSAASTLDIYAAQIAAVEELEGIGQLFRSSKAVQLTEAETEYVVQCVKHIFKEHVVFQFSCTNTLNDQILENITVEFEGGEQEVDEDDIIQVAIPELKFEQTAISYVCIPLDATITSQTFECKLDFLVKDCDPETGDVDDDEGYPDSYQIEDVDLNLADYMQGASKPNFKAAWDEMEDESQVSETFQLSDMNSLEEAVDKIIEFLGMKACERSDRVDQDKQLHQLLLAGVYAGGHPVLARAKLAFDQGVTLELDVRSPDEDTATLVCSAIA